MADPCEHSVEQVDSQPPKRRILVVLRHFAEGHGGQPESILMLAKHLRPLEVEVDVVSQEGFCWSAAQFADLGATSTEQRRFRWAEAKRRHYAIVFIVGSWNPRSLAFALWSRRNGIPLVYAAKGNLCRIEFTRTRDIKKVPYLICLESLLLLSAQRIICSSAMEQDAYALPGPLVRHKMLIIPEPFCPMPFSSKDTHVTANGDCPSIGFLAEISPRKGLIEFVEGALLAFEQLGQFAFSVRIAGSPRPGSERYLEKVRALIKQSRFSARFKWYGRLRGKARYDFYQSIDIFACPSRFESFGLTPIEALGLGKPVIMSNRLGLLEFLPANAPVKIMPDFRPTTISRAIASTLAEREDLATRARTFLTPETLTSASLASSFCEALLGQPHRGHPDLMRS